MSNKLLMKHEAGQPPILIDSAMAARMLSISPRKLWQLTDERKIPSLKIGKCVRYRVADLDEWTKQQTIEPTETNQDGEHVEHH